METGEELYLIKMKGVTLKKENAKQDFENLVKMVFKKEKEIPMDVQQFHIDPKTATIHYESMVKVLRDSSHKRHVLECGIRTSPYGTKIKK